MSQESGDSVSAAKPDRGAAILKIIIGLALGAAAFYLFTLHASQTSKRPETAAGVITGIAAGLGLWLLLSGILQLGGKRLGWFPGVAILLACSALAGVIEPKSLIAQRIKMEQDAWSRLDASAKRFEDYQIYTRSVPVIDALDPVLRKGVPAAMAMAQTREEIIRLAGLKDRRVELLRGLIREHESALFKYPDEPIQPAIDLAREELSKHYTAALQELSKRTDGAAAGREFPEDPAMRAAFAAVFARLAKSTDDYVYLAFSSKSDLTGDKSTDESVKFLDTGEAFSADRESKRWRAFRDALENSIKTAFTEPLVQFRPLSEGESRKDKIVFEVKCQPRRVPGSFTLTREGNETGNLFNIEVGWEFAIYDTDGKLLTKTQSKSNPAESFRFKVNKGDPYWAPYSVLMDSAYYNYCREITGRLGLLPPPQRGVFLFDK